MLPQMLVFLCLGLAGQRFADAADEKIVRKPYGIEMCRQLCNVIVDCGVYVLSRSSLTCCIPLSKGANCGDGVSLLPDKKQIEANIILSSAGSCQQNVRRVIISRTKGRQCVEWNYEVDKEKKKHLLGLPRMLVTPLKLNTLNQFHQLQINTSIQEEYPFIQISRRVRTIGYIPSLKRIIVDMELSPILSSFALDSSDQTILAKGLLTTVMCVDDMKQLVFVLVYKTGRRDIWRVPANGRDIGQISDLRGKIILSFSIDTQTERFYLFRGSGLYSSKYDGSDMVLLEKHSISHISLFDDIKQELYFVQGVVLHKTSQMKKTTSWSQLFEHAPAALVQYDRYMYISFYRSLQIGVLNLDTGKVEYFQTVNASWTSCALTLCIMS